MTEFIAMSIVGGVLILGAVLFAIEARSAMNVANACLERLEMSAHDYYDDLASARAKAALVFLFAGLLVLWAAFEWVP